MRFFKYIGLFLLMIIALVVNIIECIIMAISYPIRLLDFVLHKLFFYISSFTLAAAKKFNFLNVFRKYEE